MTWLNIDTLDLKYRKGQVWRISDTCYVYDVQAGDILDVPFVVSGEYGDTLVGYNLTDVTLEQVLERKALWIRKEYATFYEALGEFSKLPTGAIEYINTQRIRINVTGRIMLARQSEMRQQEFLQLAQNNPMQAIQYLLHRIQTEPTAVVPVVRDATVIPEAPNPSEAWNAINWNLFDNIEQVQLLSNDKLTAINEATWYYSKWDSQIPFFKLFLDYYKELELFVDLLKEKRSTIPILKYKFVNNALLAYTGRIEQYSSLWGVPFPGAKEPPTLTVEQVAALRTFEDVQALAKSGVLKESNAAKFRVPFFVHQGVQYYLYLTVKELRGGVPVDNRASGYIAAQFCFYPYNQATAHWHYDMDEGITTKSTSTWHTEPDAQDLKLVPEKDSRSDTYLKQVVGVLEKTPYSSLMPDPAVALVSYLKSYKGEVLPNAMPSDIVRLAVTQSVYVKDESTNEPGYNVELKFGASEGVGYTAQQGSSVAIKDARARAHATVPYSDPADVLKLVGASATTEFYNANDPVNRSYTTTIHSWVEPEGVELYQQTGWVTNFYQLAKKLLEIKGGS